jgi:wobble nucleotide-excising tRNase
MKNVDELNVEIEKIHGDIRLIEQSIKIIETNHLAHIEASISTINKVLWSVGFMLFAQLVLIVREALF